MTFAALVLTVALFATSSPAGPDALCQAPEVLRAEIESRLRAMMEEHGFPGFSYAVARSGGTVISGGTGVIDRESGVPAGGNTIYQIGSITKTFTGTVLARLVTEERIDLGNTVALYWSEPDAVPKDPDGREITLQQLATHTAGLPRYPANLEREDGDPILGFTREELRSGLVLVDLTEPFPRPQEYSNFGYGVLGEVLADSQGTDFPALLAAELTGPLRLSDTGFALTGAQRPRLATPYRDDDITMETSPWEMGALSGAGGLYSTTDDLALFAGWLLGSPDRRVSANDTELRQLQRAPLYRNPDSPSWAYGLGAFVVDDIVPGVDAIWHGGDVDGYAGSFVVLPDQDIAFTYLTNIGFANGFLQFQNAMMTRIHEICGPSRSAN